MAIQNRRGAYADFDPTKMVAGEFAVVQTGDPNADDGKAVYMAFSAGSVKRLATYEDMQQSIADATEDIAQNIEDAVADDVEAAQQAAEQAQQAAETLTIDSTLTHTGQAADAKKTGDEISSLKEDINSALTEVENVVFSEKLTIDTTDSGTYESTPSNNPQRFAHPYGFKAGTKYRLEVTVNSATFVNATNAILADTSRTADIGVSNLNTQLLRINNTNASPIVNGTVYTAEFTALATDVNILMRYKFDAGTQNIFVKCYEISDIKTDVYNAIDENVQMLRQNSRMQFGAHRGAEHYAPPNSVVAYELAGKMGFPWAWLAQIRWSADNTLYVMHDEDVSITTNGTGNLSELTDEYIESLLCNKIQTYDYTQFTNDDLRVPTLEKVIQICLRYGMKMCFRIEPFPNNMNTEQNAEIWNNFVNLIKAYGISSEWASYSAYNSLSMILCLDLLGDVEVCPFLGNSMTAQDYVDWFNDSGRQSYFVNAKKAVLMPANSVTLEGVKLLHTNGIRVYAFTNGTVPTQEQMEQLATWGVDILQNPKYAKIPIV